MLRDLERVRRALLRAGGPSEVGSRKRKARMKAEESVFPSFAKEGITPPSVAPVLSASVPFYEPDLFGNNSIKQFIRTYRGL